MDTPDSLIRYFAHSLSLILIVLGINACQTDSDTPGTEVLFESGNIAPDGTFSYTFQEEETVEYYCRIHAPDMQGVVTVTAGANISGQDTVEMSNNQFIPSQITIAPNTEIVWVNTGNEVHSIASGNPPTSGNGGY